MESKEFRPFINLTLKEVEEALKIAQKDDLNASVVIEHSQDDLKGLFVTKEGKVISCYGIGKEVKFKTSFVIGVEGSNVLTKDVSHISAFNLQDGPARLIGIMGKKGFIQREDPVKEKKPFVNLTFEAIDQALKNAQQFDPHAVVMIEHAPHTARGDTFVTSDGKVILGSTGKEVEFISSPVIAISKTDVLVIKEPVGEKGKPGFVEGEAFHLFEGPTRFPVKKGKPFKNMEIEELQSLLKKAMKQGKGGLALSIAFGRTSDVWVNEDGQVMRNEGKRGDKVNFQTKKLVWIDFEEGDEYDDDTSALHFGMECYGSESILFRLPTKEDEQTASFLDAFKLEEQVKELKEITKTLVAQVQLLQVRGS